MYQRLGSERLKTGEDMDVGFVQGPDPDWMGRLIPFLGHKEPWYEFHIAKSLAGELDGLRTRFYVGAVEDRIIAHIMVVAGRGAGILGHVYTVPQWRRKGAVSAVMRAQMRDCADLDVITLSTGYASAAYGIYHSFGFRSVVPESGDMQWLSGPKVQAQLLEPADCTVRPMRWDDWPLYSFATLQEFSAEPAPRSAAFGIGTRASSEGAFVRIMQSALGHRSEHRILEGAHGSVVGWCHIVPGQIPLSRARMLDLHTLPGFESYLPALLQDMTWPQEPVTFAMSPSSAAYADALTGLGFAADDRLAYAAKTLGSPAELQVWVRNA